MEGKRTLLQPGLAAPSVQEFERPGATCCRPRPPPGAGDFGHLPAGIACGLALTLSILWAGQRAGLGLTAVWWALAAFYSARLATHVAHYWRKGPASVFGGEGGGPPAEPRPAAAAAAAVSGG